MKSWRSKNKPKKKKDNVDRSGGPQQCTIYVGQWLSKQKKTVDQAKNGWPSIINHLQVYPRVIFSQKRMRFVFGQSRGSWGVFLTWFQALPVFYSKRTGYTRFWLLPKKLCFLPLVNGSYVDIVTKWALFIYTQTCLADRPFSPRELLLSASSYHHICLSSHSSSEWWENHDFVFFRRRLKRARGWFRCHICT